ncbi:hypothetical protein J6590_009877 [Homalodisca vitripennis]|nr:hypothetical protein J6590_009877 [Homalodisca vitripennis]
MPVRHSLAKLQTASSTAAEYKRLRPFYTKCMPDGAIFFPEKREQNKNGKKPFDDHCLRATSLLERCQKPSKTPTPTLSTTNDDGVVVVAFVSFNVIDDPTNNSKGVYYFTVWTL